MKEKKKASRSLQGSHPNSKKKSLISRLSLSLDDDDDATEGSATILTLSSLPLFFPSPTQPTPLKPRQVIAFDKLDYCASLHNLDEIKDKTNFKVRNDAREKREKKRKTAARSFVVGAELFFKNVFRSARFGSTRPASLQASRSAGRRTNLPSLSA